MGRDRGPGRPGEQPRAGKVAGEVRVDIADGPSVEVGRNGPSAVRTARVFGLKGNGAARLWFALSAPNVPKYGDIHPVIEGLPVGRIRAVLEEGSTDIATVTIEYFYYTGGPAYFLTPPDDTGAILPQIEILSSVQPARTEFEVGPAGDIQQIVVSRIIGDPDSGTSTLVEQAGSVDYMLPMETVRYMRREWRDPQWKARLYVGKINSTNVFNDAPHMWMCTRLDGVSDDGGVTFNVTYEFQRHPDSWDPWVIFTDPETGKPAVLTQDEINAREAIKQVPIYRQVNFWELNLTLGGA